MTESMSELVKELIDKSIVPGDRPIADCAWIPTKIRNAMAQRFATYNYSESGRKTSPARFSVLRDMENEEILNLKGIGKTGFLGFTAAMKRQLELGGGEASPSPTDLPLVGLIEIAQRAGVMRPMVTMWRNRHKDFPKPVAELAVGPIFWWPSVEEWLKATGRRWDANLSREVVTNAKTRPNSFAGRRDNNE